jgi:hypothetical protein
VGPPEIVHDTHRAISCTEDGLAGTQNSQHLLHIHDCSQTETRTPLALILTSIMSATQSVTCTSVQPSKFRYLQPQDAEHFLTHGWLRVPNAIKQEYIDEWMSDLWTRLDFDPNDKSTWHTEYLHLPRHREVRAEDFAPKAWDAICDLVGGEDKLDPLRERWYGDQFICNFGSAARTAEETPEPLRDRATWHIDNDWFRQFLDSSGVALTVIHCFTDVLPNGGGTILCEDAIKGMLLSGTSLTTVGVCDFFYNHPEGLDPPDHNACCAHIRQCQQFTTLEAQAGDVILLHGLLPHTNSLNYRHYARVIGNPHATLRDPYNFNRPDGKYVSSHSGYMPSGDGRGRGHRAWSSRSSYAP